MERNPTLEEAPPSAREPLAAHDVEGGGGVQLQAREWGNRDGRPILFIHGWSQSQLCWKHQIESPLAEDFHLITFDCRGHGMSERPLDPNRYLGTQSWAEDVAAVIDRTGIDRPILVGSSYGGFVITDYVRVFGEGAIAGINLAGGAVMLRPPSFDHLGPGFLENVEGASAPDLAVNIATMRRFVGALTARAPSDDDQAEMLCWNMVVPPEVRGALVSREIDSDDVLSSLTVPVLLTHGRQDAMVLPSMAEHVREVCASAEVSWYDDAGHLPFLENPARFNRELADFARVALRS
jgi:non-heme chloroperoxidase